MRIVGSAEMREIDRTAIEEMGVPGLSLMERAGRAVADAALEMAERAGRIVAICGGGNNGGDGYVAARLLHAAHRDVEVLALVPADKLAADALAARSEAARAGVRIVDYAGGTLPDLGPGDVVIDAIFGTGLAREPEGSFAEAIARICEARNRGAHVLSVDVPSGLSADAGRPIGASVRADRTITFAFLKRGLALFPGAELAGMVDIAEIGIPAEAANRVATRALLLTESEARALVLPRPRDAHKGDAGRVLVVAGSPGKTGAAHLALLGALRGGAGLVTLAAREEVFPLALAGLPEAMSVPLCGVGPLGSGDLDALLTAAEGADALVIGPGIPRGPDTAKLLLALLERSAVPAVLDADALNALGNRPEVLQSVSAPLVLTPHPGEMARLAGITVSAVQEDRIELAAAKATEWRATLVLKGARTVVADPGGLPTVIPTGNPGMATGGSGDVLAGIIGALLAGGLPPFVAAQAGAYVHGRAGDLAAVRLGERGMLAHDLAESFGQVWAEWGR